jgi:hypothetical protein
MQYHSKTDHDQSNSRSSNSSYIHIPAGSAVSYLAQEVGRWLPGFAHRSGHVGFVVDKAALGAGFLRVIRFPLPGIPPTVPHSSS